MLNREQILDLKRSVGVEPYQCLDQFKSVGSSYNARCPFHPDGGTPNLSIYKSPYGDWAYKCHRCRASGDVIKFIQDRDGIKFPDALARIGGQTYTTKSSKLPPEALIGQPSAEQTAEINQYLESHGLDLEVCKTRGVQGVIHPTLGVAITFPYDCADGVIKFRALHPKSKNEKFVHAKGKPSANYLFNIKAVEAALSNSVNPIVFVTESERDCLLMESHGYMAVSVSSASACVKIDKPTQTRVLQIEPNQLEILARADRIVLATDQDVAGQDCAKTFEDYPGFNANQVVRLQWEFRKLVKPGQTKDPKDVGEIYDQNPADFRARIDALSDEAINRPPAWRRSFKSLAELDDGDIIQLVEGFLTEGNTGLGGLSGHGKTFVALSLAKALTTGKPFVGRFKVPEIHPVLYLCPEVGERQLRKRCKMFGIPMDETLFLCRTLSEGQTLPLDHSHVLLAIRHLGKPVVFLDTAIRFSTAKDENSASDNIWMEKAVRGLREAGAVGVVLLAHSPKSAATAKKFVPTLENTFRGTSDIGAVLDIGYNIRIADKQNKADCLQLCVTNVKPRDFTPPDPFNLGLKYKDGSQMRSFIEQHGDLVLMESFRQDSPSVSVLDASEAARETVFEDAIKTNPKASYGEIAEIMGLSKSQVQKLGNKLGWSRPDGKWVRIDTTVAA